MSGLDVDKFNLFAKKTPVSKPAPRPVQVPVTSPEVVENQIEKFENQAIVNELVLSADSRLPQMDHIQVEIERFDDRPVKKSSDSPILSPITNQTIETKIEKNQSHQNLRKFETFAAPTFRIPEDHDFELKRIEQVIMRNRRRGQNTENRERITSNTVVRALLANFIERVGEIDLSNIDNEEMLKLRMKKIFK